MCAFPSIDDHLQTNALLPTFMLPRACMGIVFKFFLNYTGDPALFDKELQQRFPCCVQPREDLKNAFVFWEDFMRCVNLIAEPLGAEELSSDMRMASELMLWQQ